MAKILDLNVEPRDESSAGGVRRMRKSGMIPAVIYGRGLENQNLKVDAKTFNRLIDQSASDNILVNIKVSGKDGDQLALVQEVQHDYLKGGILHVDFHAVKADEEIHAGVSVILTGVEAAEKKGGMIEHILHTLQVRCLPKDLPEKLTLDASILNVGQSLHISDLKLPDGVKTRMDNSLVVVVLKEPTVAEEVAPAAAAAPAAGAAAAKPGDAKAAAAAPAKGAAPAKK